MQPIIEPALKDVLTRLDALVVNFVQDDLLNILKDLITSFVLSKFVRADGSMADQRYQAGLRNMMEIFFKSQAIGDGLKQRLRITLKLTKGFKHDSLQIFPEIFMPLFQQHMIEELRILEGRSRDVIVSQFIDPSILDEGILLPAFEATIQECQLTFKKQLKTIWKVLIPKGAIYVRSPPSLRKAFFSFCFAVKTSSIVE